MSSFSSSGLSGKNVAWSVRFSLPNRSLRITIQYNTVSPNLILTLVVGKGHIYFHRSSQVVHGQKFPSTGLVGDWWLVAVRSWLAWILRYWSRPGCIMPHVLVPRFIVRAVSTKQSLFFGTTWLQTQQSTQHESWGYKIWKHVMTINDPTGLQLFLLRLLGITSSAGDKWSRRPLLVGCALYLRSVGVVASSRGGRVLSWEASSLSYRLQDQKSYICYKLFIIICHYLLRYVELSRKWAEICWGAAIIARVVQSWPKSSDLPIDPHVHFNSFKNFESQRWTIFQKNNKQTYVFPPSLHDPTWILAEVDIMSLRFTGYVSKYLSTLARSVRMTGFKKRGKSLALGPDDLPKFLQNHKKEPKSVVQPGRDSEVKFFWFV